VQLRKQTSFFKRGPHALHASSHAVSSEVKPDFGPEVPDQRRGITVCGATGYVLNFNIALETTDLQEAMQIAKAIRGSNTGGLPGVESMAYEHAGPDGSRLVEVACNLREPSSQEGGQASVLERVTDLARAKGIRILHSYCTNPTPEELESWWTSDKSSSQTWEWRVPPGEENFDKS